MPTALYGRKASLIIGDVDASELDFSFDVMRTLRPEPNTCDLTVYNLSKQSRDKLQSRENVRVRIDAGYKDLFGTIFIGTLRDIGSTLQGPDWVTTLESGDAEKNMKKSRTTKAYGKGVKLKDVLTDLATALTIDGSPVGIGNAVAAFNAAGFKGGGVGDEYLNGTVLSGQTSKQFTDILKSCGLEWSIQNTELQVLTIGAPIPEQAEVLTPFNGLIGSPTISSDGVLTAISLMNTNLQPGRVVTVESAQLRRAQYRIETSEFSGVTDGTTWYVTVEAKPLRT